MINHARTLLLNKSAGQLACDWAEYVDASFVSRKYPAYMQDAWYLLFGRDPDRWYLNWMAHKYITLLQSSEYSQYMYMLDDRVTYKYPQRNIVTSELPVVVVSCSTTPEPSTYIDILGEPMANDGLGRMEHTFTISDNGDDTVDVLGRDYQATAGVDDVLDLGYSGMRARFKTGILPNSVFTVSGVALPERSLVDVCADLNSMHSPAMSYIFGSVDKEPAGTFYMLWSQSRGFALKMTGFLLAWIYKAEELANA